METFNVTCEMCRSGMSFFAAMSNDGRLYNIGKTVPEPCGCSRENSYKNPNVSISNGLGNPLTDWSIRHSRSRTHKFNNAEKTAGENSEYPQS